MTKTGRELEELVTTLEKILRGSDVEIPTRICVTGVISKVLREVDMLLRDSHGRVIVLECRDQAQDRYVLEWIEQLASKKHDVGATHIIAVSAARFSDGAGRLAEF